MNTNKLTAIFLTLLMIASIGYAQFMSSMGNHSRVQAEPDNDVYSQNEMNIDGN